MNGTLENAARDDPSSISPTIFCYVDEFEDKFLGSDKDSRFEKLLLLSFY